MLGGTRRENLPRLEEGMREIAHALAKDPLSREAIEGARNRAEGRRRMRRLSRIGQAYAMVMAEFRGEDPQHLDHDLPALHAVTPDDVRRAAARYLRFEPSIAAFAR
jgi:predicted Zn-dependent peptidase